MYTAGDILKHKEFLVAEYGVVDVTDSYYHLKLLPSGPIYNTDKDFVEKRMERVIKQKEIPLDIAVGDWVKVKNEKYPTLKNYTGIYRVTGTYQHKNVTTISIETESGKIFITNAPDKNQQHWEKAPSPEKKLISTEMDGNLNVTNTYDDGSKTTVPYNPSKAVEVATEENFEKEYAKRATKLAIKNNRVQSLIKKVDSNRKELAALQDGKWFALYGRYDWKRIFFTTLFVLLSFAAPCYAAYLWGWYWLAATPISLSVIAATIYAMRDKKLDDYIIGADNGR